MARIRSIKPEFPQSESMGNVSRDARLTFLQLFTLSDDEGRLRGNSRMLASLLFPYDDDAPALIDGWLGELEKQDCIIRYKSEGQAYVQICNWLIHQKIDKPSKSKIPEFDSHSRILANPRECSSEDQGSRIKDQGEDQGSNTLPVASLSAPPEKKAQTKTPETVDNEIESELQATCRETWAAYRQAYQERYGPEPVRNQKTNAQVKKLCQLLPHSDCAGVAQFFVWHNDAFYVRKGHDIGLLVVDAAKIRTEWVTGNRMTSTRARQLDGTSSMMDAADRIISQMGLEQ